MWLDIINLKNMSFPKGVLDVLLVISNNNDIAMENKHLHTNSCFVTFLEKHSSFFPPPELN